jgi:hypothetical protein
MFPQSGGGQQPAGNNDNGGGSPAGGAGKGGGAGTAAHTDQTAGAGVDNSAANSQSGFAKSQANLDDLRRQIEALAPILNTPEGLQQLMQLLQRFLDAGGEQLQASDGNAQLQAARLQGLLDHLNGDKNEAGWSDRARPSAQVLPAGWRPAGGAAPLTMRPESQGPHSGDDDEPYVIDDPEVLSALTGPSNELILGGGWTWADKGLGGR